MVCVQIPWRSLQPTIVRSCGSGSYADVFEVYFRQAPMAMKVLHLRSDGTTGVSEETLKHFKCASPSVGGVGAGLVVLGCCGAFN